MFIKIKVKLNMDIEIPGKYVEIILAGYEGFYNKPGAQFF